ncbi:MAG: PAS domain S-box protein [Anaerolineaceae bacterium]|nr:PAS domain S-box protein [Anaerolineaceae bacterium]MCB9101583.1 PAS domain S-box protein [Anaerolineales bacterium]
MMDARLTSLIFRKIELPIAIDRQLAKLEPLALLVLGLHGLITLFRLGDTGWQWTAVVSVLLLGGWGRSRWGQSQPALVVRAGMMLGLTWLLLFTTGSADAEFFLWYFILAAIYPMMLRPPFNLILLGAVPLAYLLSWLVSSPSLSLMGVLARSFLMGFLGWLIWSLTATLRPYALKREQSEHRLALALELAGVVIIEYSIPFSHDRYRGGPWAAILGYELEEMPFRPEERLEWVINHVHPDDRVTAKQEFSDYVAGRKEDYHYEWRVKHKSGHWVWVDGHIATLERDENGRPKRILSTTQDITHLKQAEHELHIMQSRLAGIIASAMDAIITVDADQRIILFNASAEQMFGLPADELLGQSLDRLIPDRFQQAHRRHIETFGRTRTANRPMNNREYVTGRRANGEEFPIEASISQTHIDDQLLYTVILRDISERVRAEAQLQYQANLLENVSDAIIATDLNYVIRAWNKAAEVTYGWPAAAVVGQPATAIIPTRYPDNNREAVINQLLQQGRWQGELVQQRRDGAFINIMVSTAILKDKAGRPLGTVSVNRDMTERKQIEDALRRSEQVLQLFVENAPAAIAMFDRDMRYIAASRRYLIDYELGHPDLIGRSHYEVFPETPPRWRDIHRRCLAGAVEKAAEDPFPRSDGKLDWVRWEIHPWYESSGEIGGVILFSEVITERKNLEEQYYQAQKMEAIGHLAGGVAHDFNNILVPIIGYAELGMMNLSSGDPLYKDLDLIRQAAQRAADLTRQILAFSRKQILQMHVLDLNPLIIDFEKMLQRLIGEDIELETFLAADLHPVKADQSQLEQVLLNLVINARDAMPEGGALTIETANVYLDETYLKNHIDIQGAGHYAMLAVSDTGHGMDAATQARIFDPFFTTKARGKGTGLGLATVFGIIRQHQGYIWVYSEPGRGTTFKIYLPQAESIGLAPVAAVTLEPHSLFGAETILVVEDEAMVRKLTVETLETHGYHVLEAKSITHARQLAADYRETIHLLLTDVIMPGMNGRELYQNLRERQPGLRVLYMSGYTDNVIVHHGILYEGINFLQKPFTILKLLQKVRTVLTKDE